MKLIKVKKKDGFNYEFTYTRAKRLLDGMKSARTYLAVVKDAIRGEKIEEGQREDIKALLSAGKLLADSLGKDIPEAIKMLEKAV